jgi:pimeloyl-ACP methyl ester carboxylesterase
MQRLLDRKLYRPMRIRTFLFCMGLAGCTAPTSNPATVPASSTTLGAGPNLKMEETGTGSLVIRPPGYQSGQHYPTMFLLPYVDGSAADLFNQHYRAAYPKLIARQKVILVLPEGIGEADDFATPGAWLKTVERYEQKVQWDIERWGHRFGVDRERVALAGYSMGGDLAWALTQRHPERYAGAIVMGSRCSYRGKDSAEAPPVAGLRYFISMGETEDSARLAGAKAAVQLLQTSTIPHRYLAIPGGHVPAPADAFVEAVAFVFAED